MLKKIEEGIWKLLGYLAWGCMTLVGMYLGLGVMAVTSATRCLPLVVGVAIAIVVVISFAELGHFISKKAAEI